MPANQSFERLNRAVRAIAAIVGIAAGVGIPLGFALVTYFAQVSNLQYRTSLAADRLAEYIYIQDTMWRFNETRIIEMIGFTRIEGRQIVYDAAGRRVAELGNPVEGATLRVASPIMVRGAAVGQVEAEVSLTPLLIEISAFTFLGLALGAAVFAGAYFIPQGAFRAANAEHLAVQEDLRAQIEQTHSALMTAREATRAKSAFLAMMSHEIRTPMNAVMGLSSSLLESPLESEQRRLVSTIYESSNSLLRLLNDILDYSKLDAGKIDFEAIAFSPAALVDHTVSIMAAKAEEKGLGLKAVIGPDLPGALIGDSARLQQVLLNLSTNAVKFTERGSIEIGIRLLWQGAEAASIECWVRDTGIGIAPDQVDKLFNEFTQADTSINRRFGGTGLGLVISKRIVEQMRGEIAVSSTAGSGSTFSFRVTLPRTDPSALAATAPADTRDFAAVLGKLPRPLRVLLAEDNATNQFVFSKLVQGLNFDLTFANDGRAAVEQARARTFDIVFMDMRMPEMDGLEATRAIRALGGEWSTIPIVALTANAFAEDVQMCRDAGMNDFIAKPLRKKVLIDHLATVLADHPAIRKVEALAAMETPAAAGKPAPRPDLPAIDKEIFDELAGVMDPGELRSLYDVFIAETEARLARLRNLSCEADRPLIRDEAHTLKGAAGTSGLPALSEAARQLEYAAPTAGPAEYASLLDRVASAFADARRALDRAVGNPGLAA